MINRTNFTKDELETIELNGLSLATVRKRIYRGWQRSKAISKSNCKNKYVLNEEDYNTLKSNNISSDVYFKRVKKGWNKEKALTKPQKNYPPKYSRSFTDSEKRVMSINEIDVRLYTSRRGNNWSHEESIYIPREMSKNEITKGKYPLSIDELKTLFENSSSLYTYRRRRELGWSKEKALTTERKTYTKEVHLLNKKE